MGNSSSCAPAEAMEANDGSTKAYEQTSMKLYAYFCSTERGCHYHVLFPHNLTTRCIAVGLGFLGLYMVQGTTVSCLPSNQKLPGTRTSESM